MIRITVGCNLMREIFFLCVLDEQVALKQQQQCSAPGRLQVQQIFHSF